MEKNKLPVSNLLLSRTKFIELIIVAIFLGFGISLTSSSITVITDFKPMVGIYIGGVICILSVIYISSQVFVRRKKGYLYKGFFILNEQENKIVKIEGYDLSETIREYFETAFLENKDLKHIWDCDSLNLQDELKIPEPRSMDIIREALEYFLLDKLSTHLTDYFKHPFEKNISVLQRKDIPSVLLTNRFLELFSKPIKDRAAFLEIEQEEDVEWYILDVEGGTYRKFSLVLPYKSKVIRTNKGEIEIKTHKFDISMKVNFDGCNTVLPAGFEEHYLSIYGFENSLANVVYQVEFDFHIKFNITSLFSSFGWKDYKWIDTFLNSIDNSVTKESFFTKINWTTVATLIKCLNK
ncbi:hypothetical protein KTC96_14245 [Clostridium estertheticum]|uniref:hypothetical protein n=1 Tax=Clostridium estertheticum TaxID=238834 RepID=UPI001C7CAEAF|nr:hypothetical protein [Clostridium estertheticum]MBX4258844.1 hypothetical protein [Clostridium estertheticum]WLC69150.1 hypothetical protein KTC96_14245 [Clostridium estertheticum]